MPTPSEFAAKLASETDGNQFGIEAWELRAGAEAVALAGYTKPVDPNAPKGGSPKEASHGLRREGSMGGRSSPAPGAGSTGGSTGPRAPRGSTGANFLGGGGGGPALAPPPLALGRRSSSTVVRWMRNIGDDEDGGNDDYDAVADRGVGGGGGGNSTQDVPVAASAFDQV